MIDSKPIHYRPQMFSEAAHYLAIAFHEDDTSERAWNAGAGLGYLVAFGLAPRSLLTDARRVPFARPEPHPTTHPFADETTQHAVGVRYGYWNATAELVNIEECALCGERIVLAVDNYEECAHEGGLFFCEDNGCYQVFHAGVRRCPAETS